jgi:hypothetical protein
MAGQSTEHASADRPRCPDGDGSCKSRMFRRPLHRWASRCSTLCVSTGQCVRDFSRDPDGVAHGQLPFAVPPVAQGLAFDERHDVEEKAVRPESYNGSMCGQIAREIDGRHPARTEFTLNNGVAPTWPSGGPAGRVTRTKSSASSPGSSAVCHGSKRSMAGITPRRPTGEPPWGHALW